MDPSNRPVPYYRCKSPHGGMPIIPAESAEAEMAMYRETKTAECEVTHPLGFYGFGFQSGREWSDELDRSTPPPQESEVLVFEYHELHPPEGTTVRPPPPGHARFVMVWGGDPWAHGVIPQNQLAAMIEAPSHVIALVIHAEDEDAFRHASQVESFWRALEQLDVLPLLTRFQMVALRTMMSCLTYILEDWDRTEFRWWHFRMSLLTSTQVYYSRADFAIPPPAEYIWYHFWAIWGEEHLPAALEYEYRFVRRYAKATYEAGESESEVDEHDTSQENA